MVREFSPRTSMCMRAQNIESLRVSEGGGKILFPLCMHVCVCRTVSFRESREGEEEISPPPPPLPYAHMYMRKKEGRGMRKMGKDGRKEEKEEREDVVREREKRFLCLAHGRDEMVSLHRASPLSIKEKIARVRGEERERFRRERGSVFVRV